MHMSRESKEGSTLMWLFSLEKRAFLLSPHVSCSRQEEGTQRPTLGSGHLPVGSGSST